MLLRDKKYTCTVPKRKNPSGPSLPEVPFPDPMLVASMTVNKKDEEFSRYKLLVFRVPEDLKMRFKMSLLKNHLDIQHTFEAFVELFISWSDGEKIPDVMKAVVRRSITLMNGV